MGGPRRVRAARLFHQPARPAGAAVPVDRLCRQPRAGQRDPRPVARRCLRAPQCRERGRAQRHERAVGDAVRDRPAAGPPRDGGGPLRLRRRARGTARPARGRGGQLDPPRAGRAQEAPCLAGHTGGRHREAAGPVRAQCAGAGPERLRDHRGPGRLGPQPDRGGARLGLWPAQRPARRPRDDRAQCRGGGTGLRTGTRRAETSAERAQRKAGLAGGRLSQQDDARRRRSISAADGESGRPRGRGRGPAADRSRVPAPPPR
mmetsp:Transcript_26227/g.61968  ORF Transcript_26227/g.61968 Transcript_26227/m.61968 type:complete len:261 (-) Transcript_26227:4329-5111(-)